MATTTAVSPSPIRLPQLRRVRTRFTPPPTLWVSAKATHTTIPPNYPVVGHDAFRTATGVHAAALMKAFRKNDVELANAVYSGVPAHLFGLDQVIEIGPMSGKSNILYWLERHRIPADETVVARILDAAKQSARVLTDAEVLALCTEAARN